MGARSHSLPLAAGALTSRVRTGRRSRSVSLVAVTATLCLSVAACSEDSRQARHLPTTTSQDSSPVPVPTTPRPTASPSDLTACARTIEPFLRHGLTHENGLTEPLAPLEGESLLVGAPEPGLPDVDGQWGDLNGDGVEDSVVTTLDGIYVVPGPLVPGADPKSAGVHLAHTIYELHPGTARPVGDQNGDGAADVAFDERLTSGRALLANPPGSTIDIPKPFAIVAQLSGAVRIDPGEPPALVQIIGRIPAGGTGEDLPIEVKLAGAEPICLVTSNRSVDPS